MEKKTWEEFRNYKNALVDQYDFTYVWMGDCC